MEKLLTKSIVKHLEENDLISSFQHGFRTGRLCLTQLLEYFEELEDALDDGDCLDVAHLDCKKAFDTFSPFEKLKSRGIEGRILVWIEYFLCGRQQRVSVR